MRSEKEIISMMISTAENDSRIRAVILNGSRTNKKVAKDDLQDFDIIYLVRELETFKMDANWIDLFGKRIIMQEPNSMQLYGLEPATKNDEIAYLMLFKDLNRIDLTLIELKNKSRCTDSLNKILLDKDGFFDKIPEPTDRDYWVRKPTQKEFSDSCNEFWWVSTYVLKGLVREELIYTKEMLEGPVRQMFMCMISWKVGIDFGFKINLGKCHKFIEKHLESDIWTQILHTYPDLNKENIWNSLLIMADLFDKTSKEVAEKLQLNYNQEEANNLKEYMREMEQRILK